MGRGSSKISGGGGASAGGNANDQALTRQFLDGIANSQSDTQIALDSAMVGSKFSLLSDTGEKTEYQKLNDGRWQQTISSNGTITSQMVVDADRAALAAFNNRADVFSMNLKGASPIPKSQVSVSTSDYSRSHMGKSPSGTGMWAFDIGGKQVFISGKYADAKKKAIAQAASQGIRRVMTLG